MVVAQHVFYVDRFSGPGGVTGLVCVCLCLCVWTITFELNEFSPRYLPYWFILTLSSLVFKVKLIDKVHGHGMKNVKMFLFLYLLLFLLKWSMRPRERTF